MGWPSHQSVLRPMGYADGQPVSGCSLLQHEAQRTTNGAVVHAGCRGCSRMLHKSDCDHVLTLCRHTQGGREASQQEPALSTHALARSAHTRGSALVFVPHAFRPPTTDHRHAVSVGETYQMDAERDIPRTEAIIAIEARSSRIDKARQDAITCEEDRWR